MAFRVDDRWLWLGAGAALWLASKGIAHGLRRMVDINVILDPEDREAHAATSPEDSIGLSTLSTLVKSPNGEISRAAIRLIVARFLKSPEEQQAWTDDLFSPKATTRQSAEKLNSFLQDQSFPGPRGLQGSQLAHLIRLSTGRRGLMLSAQTIRAAYAIARDAQIRGNQAPMLLLSDLSMSMQTTEHDFVASCPLMSATEFPPWIRAMRASVMLAHAPPHRKPLLRQLREAAIREMHAKAQTSNEATEDWLTEAESMLFPPPDHIDANDLDDSLLLQSPLSMGEIDRRLRTEATLLANFSQYEAPEESPEEAEVRRRRREAMVFVEGHGEMNGGAIIPWRETEEAEAT